MTTPSIFVTGATGVIGRLLVPELVRLGHKVTAVGRSAEKRAELERMGATGVAFDMYNVDAATRTLAGHDVVINLATHMPPSSFHMMFRRSWRENDHVRREGSATLVEAARRAGVKRFIQESFAPTYEDHGAAWIDEEWKVRAVPYNVSTLDAESSAQRFAQAGGTGVTLRYAGFYGPDRVLADLVKMAKKGWFGLPGEGSAYWSSIAHADAASATVAALGVPSGIYNVCDDEPMTRQEWADTLAKLVGRPTLRLMPGWIRRVNPLFELLSRSQRMSNRKLRQATGWAPRWSCARDGVQAAVRAL